MTKGQDKESATGQDANEGLSRLRELLQREPMPLKEIADLINEHIPHHRVMLDYAVGHLYAGHRYEGVDLSGLDLSEADLSGRDLSWVNFEGAELWGVNLRDANLRHANLRDADLAAANLPGANLEGADLTGANLYAALYDGETVWPDGFDDQNSGAFGPDVNLSAPTSAAQASKSTDLTQEKG